MIHYPNFTMRLMLSDYLKTFPQYIIPKHSLTTFAGFMANVKKTAIKNYLIKDFIKKYQVDMSEALQENPEQYASFNDFFIRHLKPDARPIAPADIVSPVDGYVSEIGRITAGKLIQAKGRDYTVQKLLALEPAQNTQFDHGLFATLYLSPKDYHRVHMPLEATVKEMTYVPGKLFSVQPTTARVIPQLFARNERLVVLFDTLIGPMAMVLVGATIVGGIGTSWHGDIIRQRTPRHFDYSESHDMNSILKKAQEMGYFKLGSTVIVLFAEGHRLSWNEALKAGDRIRLGQALASIN